MALSQTTSAQLCVLYIHFYYSYCSYGSSVISNDKVLIVVVVVSIVIIIIVILVIGIIVIFVVINIIIGIIIIIVIINHHWLPLQVYTCVLGVHLYVGVHKGSLAINSSTRCSRSASSILQLYLVGSSSMFLYVVSA